VAAYLVADVAEITDRSAYDRYKPLVPPTLETFGGSYLARGGTVTVLEGWWRPSQLVIVRFDHVEQATQWWNSVDYAGPKQLRQQATKTNMIVVEGV